MGGDALVSLKQLASELGMDRSNARRIVLRQAEFLGIRPARRIMPDSGGQPAMVVTREEADRLLKHRADAGFSPSSGEEAISAGRADIGVFYVIRLVPDLKPSRLKLGFATDPTTRLSQHRTSAPTAMIERTWPCRRAWERTAADCATAVGAVRIGMEVFDVESVEAVLLSLDELFAMLPAPMLEVPYAGTLTADEEAETVYLADDP